MKRIKLLEEFLGETKTYSVNEAFEVHYSDGIRAFKKFNNEKQAIDFARDLIKNKKGLTFVDVFKTDSNFHSTADTNAIIAFWGDGSYTDNVAKHDPKLADKKINESIINEGLNSGDKFTHKHNSEIEIELIEPTSKGWKVYQIEKGKKKIAYFDKQDISGDKAIFTLNEEIVNEAKELSSYKIGDEVKFSNGEIWKVAKPGVKYDKVFLAPFNDIAKKGHVSVAIEFTADELKDAVSESKVNEALSQEQKMVETFLKRVAKEFDYSIQDAARFVKDTISKMGLHESKVNEGVVSIRGGRILAHRVLDKLTDLEVISVKDKTEELVETIANVIVDTKM
jgi:hypothetical protein